MPVLDLLLIVKPGITADGPPRTLQSKAQGSLISASFYGFYGPLKAFCHELLW